MPGPPNQSPRPNRSYGVYLATSVRLGGERETDQGRGIEADVHQNRQT